jgi:uncharacterized protein YcbK (DUF882 family)
MGATSQHFTDHELACHHCGVNGCLPELVSSLELLRSLASRKMGRDTPVYIDDAYRCAAWNARTPNAASHSQHVLGNAADVRIPGFSAAELWSLVLQIPAFRGVGRADFQDYIHVDTRETPARWCYSAAGVVVPWYDAGVAA